MLLRFLLLSLFIYPLLSACQTLPVSPSMIDTRDWHYADLRLLDPPDTQQPGADLIALYARCEKDYLQVRVDWLDDPSADLYIALDFLPGGMEFLPLHSAHSKPPWDALIAIPASGSNIVHTASSQTKERVRSWQDQQLDATVVEWNQSAACVNSLRLQAFATLPGENSAVDYTDGVGLNSSLPTRAPLLLAFWTTLPGATPAQALRRWSGAHTGPYGQRHGLGVLLQSARKYAIPLALLDLKMSSSLSALDALGKTETVHEMEQEGLLLLPVTEDNQNILSGFGFSGSSFIYNADSIQANSPARFRFAQLPDRRHILTTQNQIIIPLPAGESLVVESTELEVDEEGLSLASRRALLEAALSVDVTDLVVMGGSLPTSPWADSLISDPAFSYLAQHPWIDVLNRNSLVGWPIVTAQKNDLPDCSNWLCAIDSTSNDFSSRIADFPLKLPGTPNNSLLPFVEKSVQALTRPAESQELADLQAAYLGDTGVWLRASAWAAQPDSIQSCEEDLDSDGLPECILASSTVFTAIDPDGGRLLFAAFLSDSSAYPVIASFSQYGVGLSDPSLWKPERGNRADPDILASACDDPGNEIPIYFFEFHSGNQLIMQSEESELQKTYSLTDSGIRIEINGPSQVQCRVPLTVDPLQSQIPGWATRYLRSQPTAPGVLHWGPLGRRLEMRVDAPWYRLDTFNDSAGDLLFIENPNREYPAGHYLPFTAAVLEFIGQQSIALEIQPAE